jgi:imidazolonepropionase-like amidohydrolase
MATLFTGGWVWDGSLEARFAADVLVKNGKVAAIDRQRGNLAETGAEIIDAAGATLIPGLVDAHGHLSFPVSTYAYQIEDTPPEETLLITLHNARLLLDCGFTGVIGAGSPKLRTEIVIRNEIDSGRIPGPRLLASSPTLTATGGLNDIAQMHQQRAVAAMIADGPLAMRQAVRLCYREGVDVIKLNVSGDDFFPRPTGRTTTMAEDEMAEAGLWARELGLMISAHARSAESIKRALRHGATLIHHTDFADAEALDLMEAARDRIFVSPTIGYYHSLLHESPFDKGTLTRMGVEDTMAKNIQVHTELRKRGVRAVIGGDYGLPWQLNGLNARDVAHFVTYLGYTPLQALHAATFNGGVLMGKGAGTIKPGATADLLLVAGDPTTDPSLVAGQHNLQVIMKGGAMHKSLPPEAARQARAA